jgi:hypothetical protein
LVPKNGDVGGIHQSVDACGRAGIQYFADELMTHPGMIREAFWACSKVRVVKCHPIGGEDECGVAGIRVEGGRIRMRVDVPLLMVWLVGVE